MNQPLQRPLLFSLLALGTATALAGVKLPPAISDHMVLQREFAAPIWGTAAPGEEVSVSISGQTKTTTADDKGNWKVKLDPLKVAEGLTLTVKGTNTIEIKDVLVGEVWVGSGQSNMDMLAKGYTANDPVLAKAVAENYPKLRLLSKGRKGWEEATPENNENFSALLFSFGFRLQQDIKIPVGIMVGAVGGTPSGFWLTEEMYRNDAACQEVVKQFAATYDFEAEKKKYEEELPKWKAAADAAKRKGQKPPRPPAAPTKPGECAGKIGNLYEAHILPYVGYGIRGVLWDQGESGTKITGVDQYTLMGALIRGWRKAWGQGDFPFLYIQKPSGGGPAWDYDDPITKNASKLTPLPAAVPQDSGAYRETHIKISTYPNTAMVTSTDLGSGIHPTNKSGYGARAVRVALGFVYGEKMEFYGPVYESHKIEDGKVRIKFSHTGQGLTARHADKLQGFAVAGEDKKFVWADAVIDGDSVVVSSASVPKPAAVRYAWAGSFPWANLFNKDGLPAQTFRTDDWK